MVVEAQYNNIYLSGRGRAKGTLAVADEEFRWKAHQDSKTKVIPASDIQQLTWTQLGHHYQLKIMLQSGLNVRFQGFRMADRDTFDKLARNVTGKSMDDEVIATNGWNWGTFDFKDVSQSVIQGKNEVSLEFHQDDTVQADEDCLVEMRLYVPPTFKVGDEDEDNDEQVGDSEESKPAVKSAVEKFQGEILERAQLGENDESIASFENVLFITPRGRYDLEMYSTYFKLHGKSYSYKILYKSVNRLFMLPRPAGQTTLVVGLDPPIRQGNTVYPYLQLSFKDEDEIELKPNLPAEVLLKKYEGKLSATMTGSYFDVLGKVVSAFTSRKINAPGTFKTAADERCIRCSHRANDGFLFPLEKSLFFIHKPPVYVRHEDISSVEFLRVGGASTSSASRTFDLLLNLRSSEHLSFTGMNREEYRVLFDYFRSKKLLILNEEGAMDAAASAPTTTTTTRSGRNVVKGGDSSASAVILPGAEESDEDDEDYGVDGKEEEEDEEEEEEVEEEAEDEEESVGDSEVSKKKRKSEVVSDVSKSSKKQKTEQ